MINILRIHKLNTTKFIFFSKQNAIIVLLLTYYLSLYLNHGDLKNILQKVISKLLMCICERWSFSETIA
jgi:hypothetical protein